MVLKQKQVHQYYILIESMAIRDLRTLHKNGMSKLRKLLPKKARIIYDDGSSCVVPCTVSDQKIDLLKYTEYTGRDIKVFHILIEDLKEVGAKITGFTMIEFDRVKYQVQTKNNNGIYGNTIILETAIYRDGLNE